MLSVLIAAAALIAASLIVGGLASRAFQASAWTWVSAPVGFSLLMLITAPAPALPGRMIIPLIVTGLLVVAGLVLMVREPDHRPPLISIAVVAPTALFVTLPFLANGRVGVLGVGFNNDTAAHLWLAEGMRSAAVEAATPILDYYPLGPHGLVGALAALGIAPDLALTGLIVAVPVLIAATAQAFLSATAWPLRIPIVLLTALPFLGASYVAQGAFKETVMVLLLVGFAAALQDAGNRDDTPRFLAPTVLLAGIVSAYSYLGLAWAVAGLGLVSLAWLVRCWNEGRLAAIGNGLAGLIPPITAGFLLSIALLAPQFKRIQEFYAWNAETGIKENDIGNLAGPISPRETLGVWWTGDFRFAPADMTISTAGGWLVGLLCLGSALWWVRRGYLSVPAMAAGAAVIAYVAHGSQSPYTVAKAFVLVSPFVFLLIGRAVTEGAADAPRLPRAALLSASAIAVALALWSSGLALRSAQVGAREHAQDLSALRPVVDGKPTLYLGLNDFLTYELRGTPATQPFYGVPAFTPNAQKGWEYGQSFDVDSVPAKTLDQFAFVVAPNVTSDSEMPENFELVTVRGVYALYRRTGPTQPRSVLAEGQDGVANLDCSTPEGRRLVSMGGVAGVRGPQVRVPLGPIPPRRDWRTQLVLTPGVWDLSLRYTSGRAITLTGPGLRKTLPASLERVGSVWPAGSLTVTAPTTVPLVLTPEYRSLSVDASTQISPTELIAQRRGRTRTLLLREACGQSVDWYRSSPQTADRPTEERPSEG